MDRLLKDVVGGDDNAVGEEGLLDGGVVDGPGAGPEAEGKRHYVPFNVQGSFSTPLRKRHSRATSLAFSCTTHA